MQQTYFPDFEPGNIAGLLYCPGTRIYRKGRSLDHSPLEGPEKKVKKKIFGKLLRNGAKNIPKQKIALEQNQFSHWEPKTLVYAPL